MDAFSFTKHWNTIIASYIFPDVFLPLGSWFLCQLNPRSFPTFLKSASLHLSLRWQTQWLIGGLILSTTQSNFFNYTALLLQLHGLTSSITRSHFVDNAILPRLRSLASLITRSHFSDHGCCPSSIGENGGGLERQNAGDGSPIGHRRERRLAK